MLAKVFQYSPSLFWAAITIFTGILVGKVFQKMSERFFERIRLNSVVKRIGIKESFEKIGISLDVQLFFSKIVQWFFIILFLMMFFEILGLTKFVEFLEKVILYFQNIFISMLIFIFACYLTDFSQKVFIGYLEKAQITFSKVFGKGTSFLIWLLASLAILYQLKIVPELILVAFLGVVLVVALVLGISFGFAGKEIASRFLKEFEEKLK